MFDSSKFLCISEKTFFLVPDSFSLSIFIGLILLPLIPLFHTTLFSLKLYPQSIHFFYIFNFFPNNVSFSSFAFDLSSLFFIPFEYPPGIFHLTLSSTPTSQLPSFPSFLIVIFISSRNYCYEKFSNFNLLSHLDLHLTLYS